MKLRKMVGVLLVLGMSLTLCLAFSSAQTTPNGSTKQKRNTVRNKRQSPLNVMQFKAKDIATALSLTSDQESQIASIQEKYQTNRKSLLANIQGKPDPATRKQLRDELKTANESILNLLNDDQKTTLRSLVETERLLGGRLPLTTIQDLKLTDDQKAQMDAIVKDAMKQIRELPKDTSNPDANKTQRQEILKNARDKIMSLLNDDQKALLKKSKKGRRTR